MKQFNKNDVVWVIDWDRDYYGTIGSPSLFKADYTKNYGYYHNVKSYIGIRSVSDSDIYDTKEEALSLVMNFYKDRIKSDQETLKILHAIE